MMKYHKYIFLLLTISLASCATKGIKMAKGEREWVSNYPQDSKIKHSIYLIGDAGGSDMGETTIPLIELQKQLKVDNRDDDKTDGNHDWYEFGREGLKRQEVYIEDYLAQYNENFTDYFRPSDGCGDVAVHTVADKLAIISIDSHWFLKDMPRSGEYDFSDCEIQTRKQFVSAFADTLARLKDHDIMLTMHHPFYTTGKHGGYFKFSSYLMPLTEYKKQIRIPLPMSGYIVNNFRARVSEQDTKSAPYATYRQALIPKIEKHGKTIVAAGHEHTLQYHVINDVDYIVSGSGSKEGIVQAEKYTKFAYGNYGYVLVDYHSNGCNHRDNHDITVIYVPTNI